MSVMPDEPYVGPRPFERGDRDLFFGRDRETNELVSLITAHPVVLLYGRSGVGKSSLLNAKLIPTLEAELFSVLPVGHFRLPSAIGFELQSVANVFILGLLTSLSPRISPSRERTGIDTFLGRSDCPGGDHSTPRVLIIDQFEELFVSFPECWADRKIVFEQISQSLEEDRLLRVVLAMREDYIAELDPYATFLLEGLQTRFRLESLREEAAVEAVKRPLWNRDQSFEDGVAERLVEDLLTIRTASGATARGEFVEPVQLQVVCRNLWRNLQITESKAITIGHLARFGDVDQVLSDLYERSVRTAAIAHGIREGAIRRWFEENLITPARTRGAVFRSELDTGGIPNAALDDLERERLLACVVRGGARWYELAHDRLIEPVLESNRLWLLTHSGAEQMRAQLEERATMWAKGGRGPEALLAEHELREAERWLSGSDAEELGVSELLRSYLQATRVAVELTQSRAVADAQQLVAESAIRRARTLRLRLAGTGLLLVIMAALRCIRSFRNGSPRNYAGRRMPSA